MPAFRSRHARSLIAHVSLSFADLAKEVQTPVRIQLGIGSGQPLHLGVPSMRLPSVILILGGVASLAAAPKQTITKKAVFDAIMIFRVDPLSEDGRQAGAVVMQFVDENHDVLVKLSSKTLPFLSNKSLPEKYRATLLAAFVVGNTDSQLLRHQKKDDSYAGVLQMIESYRQMRRKNPSLRIAELEKFIEMQRRGELKAYVSS